MLVSEHWLQFSSVDSSDSCLLTRKCLWVLTSFWWHHHLHSNHTDCYHWLFPVYSPWLSFSQRLGSSRGWGKWKEWGCLKLSNLVWSDLVGCICARTNKECQNYSIFLFEISWIKQLSDQLPQGHVWKTYSPVHIFCDLIAFGQLLLHLICQVLTGATNFRLKVWMCCVTWIRPN